MSLLVQLEKFLLFSLSFKGKVDTLLIDSSFLLPTPINDHYNMDEYHTVLEVKSASHVGQKLHCRKGSSVTPLRKCAAKENKISVYLFSLVSWFMLPRVLSIIFLLLFKFRHQPSSWEWTVWKQFYKFTPKCLYSVILGFIHVSVHYFFLKMFFNYSWHEIF